MAENLVIVESPAKAGTIAKYLGSNFQVLASMGHVRDLPSSKLGVDTAEGFTPQYVIPLKARPNLKKLQAALKGKKRVYLASDLDREGEAIAWHVFHALKLDNQTAIEVHRITFDEITKTAITHAVANPRGLNNELIDAQQARRVLDRLVGYTLSPVLWKKIYKGLSAGRVQSVALRLIVDREAERDAFNPVEYWSIEAMLTHVKEKITSTAKLVTYAGKKIEQLTISNGDEAAKMEAELKGATYTVTDVTKKPVKRKPSAPYTTSSFQQDAVNKLGMSAKNAMRTAQRLYEAGHITYMRTDSVDMAAEAVTAVRDYISKEFGPTYIPATPNKYTSKSKGAQEAHEAIRPTNPAVLAEDVDSDAGVQKVYNLIRSRALASQMAEAQLEQTAVSVSAAEAVFRITGQRVVFPGFLAAGLKQKEDEQLLPAFAEGDVLTLEELKAEQHFTEPPPRFSEATLIKALEENGIGRPSTYAPTIDTLQQRKYVLLEQRRFIPESVGVTVTTMLKENFPSIVDLNFTAEMEEKLDLVAEGKVSYKDLLGDFWEPFNKLVTEKSETIEKLDMTEATDEICPTCGAPMIIKIGRFGKFLACTKFPDCKTTKPLKSADPTGLLCPIDGKDLIWKRAKRGAFIGCSGYPDCKFALWKKEQLPAKIEEQEKEGVAVPFKEASLAAFATLPPAN
jgi:DNA topoisomerase I